MPSLHPVSFWILAGLAAALGLTPLIFLALDKRLSPALRSDLWTRYKSWLVLVPLMTVPLVLGRLPAIIAVALLGTVCYREFARATGLFRYRLVSGLVALGGLFITFAIADHWYGFFVALPSLTVTAIIVFALFADQPKGYIQRVALGVLAFLLFGVSLGHFSYFANDRLGPPLQLAIVLCVEMNDIFAYCTGKLFGRRKLAPNTSPNKTIGGALGALVLTTALFATLAHFIFRGTVLDQPVHLLTLGVLLSLTGQWGDLVMSSIKRDLGLKDMGTTIPGHGGMLDRFDSLIFVGPALFHYIGYFLGVGLDQPMRVFSGH
ncbi:MAG: phosphatidate cytidylyltransferase [Chthoniobacter sp.]|jgi:phosphatidate cytidylyltransferase|nr:phosphatidate cytidylyltransferase [Chthoniobacter sp.]